MWFFVLAGSPAVLGKGLAGAVVENSYCACRSATAGGQKDAVKKITAGASHK